MYIQGNGISIHYQIDGPENAPTVVLSHSLAANLRMWDGQMSALLQHFRVLRYDTRGHGQTDAPTGNYTLELLARDLFSLMDGLRIDAAHFVGLSMGGMIGQAAALENSSRFHSISLCDTSSRLPPEALPIWKERIATAQSEGMDAMVEPTIGRWFSQAFQERCGTVVDPIRAMIRSTPLAGYCGCSQAIMGLNLTEQIAIITLPTLLIVGRDDPGTPVAAHKVIQQQIAGSELIVIPDALHFSNIEQRETFNTELVKFLKQHA
jgi:3-oxoadipate enol-lactonase